MQWSLFQAFASEIFVGSQMGFSCKLISSLNSAALGFVGMGLQIIHVKHSYELLSRYLSSKSFLTKSVLNSC